MDYCYWDLGRQLLNVDQVQLPMIMHDLCFRVYTLPFSSQLLPVRQKMKWDEEWHKGIVLFGIMKDSATKHVSP